MRDFLIWNEPNNVEGAFLDPPHFAALLYNCWTEMTNAPQIYWGGIFMNHRELGINEPYPDEKAYIDQVYGELQARGLVGSGGGGWPWSGINIHVHHERSAAYMGKLADMINQIRGQWGETGQLIIGEWGVDLQEYQWKPDSLSIAYGQMRNLNPGAMFYFAHTYVDERPLGLGEWGLRCYSPVPGSYARCVASPPVSCGDLCPDDVLRGEAGKTILYDPYDVLVGS